MFEKFGNFNSAEEINELAKNLLKEGDIESLYEMAEENGFDRDDADDFIDAYNADDTEVFCTDYMAAIGKLDVESREFEKMEIVSDWVEYIKMCCMENTKTAKAVRSSQKSLKECIASLIKYSYTHMYSIDREIIALAGITGQCKLGIPGQGTAKKLIDAYYGEV